MCLNDVLTECSYTHN